VSLPTKVRTIPGVVADRAHLVDRIFFGLGTIAAIWLAYALVQVNDRLTWWTVVALVVFWLVLAYLALPRLNRILATIYVPDYFIGRTRTSDGLLGDPLNLAVRGTAEQLATVMKRAGWTLADPVDLSSSAKIVAATLARRSYPEAPVSPLFLFGRAQDAAYQQEVDGNPGQRHHVRFWRTPDGWPLPGGARVDGRHDAPPCSWALRRSNSSSHALARLRSTARTNTRGLELRLPRASLRSCVSDTAGIPASVS